MLVAGASCDMSQTLEACLGQVSPSMGVWSASLVQAAKELIGSYFSAGAPAVLALVVVLYVLSRVIPLLLLLLAGIPGKERR